MLQNLMLMNTVVNEYEIIKPILLSAMAIEVLHTTSETLRLVFYFTKSSAYMRIEIRSKKKHSQDQFNSSSIFSVIFSIF